MTFLSNDLNGFFKKKNVLVHFVYSMQQQFFIFELHAAYLPGQKACVPMCSLFICVSKGQVLPSQSHNTEMKTKLQENEIS